MHIKLRNDEKILQQRYSDRFEFEDFLKPLLSGDIILHFNSSKFDEKEK